MLLTQRELLSILLVGVLSFVVHIPGLSHPNEVVFDEIHFGGYITDYINGVCFFDIHPPLAKLALAGVAKLGGYKGDFNFSRTNKQYNYTFYVPMRRFMAVASSCVGPMLTASLELMGVPIGPSVLSGVLYSLDFISITQSRLILTDSLMYFFISLTILLCAIYKRHRTWTLIFFQAIAASSAFSIKFTAAGVFIFVAFFHIFDGYKKPHFFLHLCAKGFIFASVAIVEMFSLVALHLSLMPKNGYGDLYMPKDFRRQPMYIRVPKLIIAMYRYNKGIKNSHPYQSRFYQWPLFLSEPILTWHGPRGQYLYFLNNPISAFLSLVGFCFGFNALSIAYFISFVPFVFVQRCTFAYHYEIPLIFGVAAFGTALGRLSRKWRNIASAVLGVHTFVAYMLWLPWIYGTPASNMYHSVLSLWPHTKEYHAATEFSLRKFIAEMFMHFIPQK